MERLVLSMKRKSEIASQLPLRRGLSLDEAAVYVGVGPTMFLRLVSQRQMPKPVMVGGRKVWDVRSLDAAFDDLPRENGGGTPGQNAWSEHWVRMQQKPPARTD